VRAPDLATELADQPFGVTTSPWRGYEANVGYAVVNLPMSTGHQLALRVFPRSDFGGYVSVWHRDPAGAWSQFVDRAPVEAGCPRAWGPALTVAAPASIELQWTAPNVLEVDMDRPRLRWRMSLATTVPLRIVNALHRRLPRATWRRRTLVRVRESALRLLGLGAVRLAGTAPVGVELVAALRRMYWVDGAAATLDGEDLGDPVVLGSCPTIGGWPLPRRGVFAIGEAHGRIRDRGEYERLRRRTGSVP
jgi:hypothetical protein